MNNNEEKNKILISVQTEHINKTKCEKIINEKVCKILNNYYKKQYINIIQFSEIADKVTEKLSKNYEMRSYIIAEITKDYIIKSISKENRKMKYDIQK